MAASIIDISILSTGIFGQVLLLLIIWYFIDQWDEKKKRRPPGPPRIPILGSFPIVVPGALMCPDGVKRFDCPPYILLHNLSQRYGPVFYFKFGIQKCLVVSDFDLAKETFAKSEFDYRYLGKWLKELRQDGAYGLLLNNGEGYRQVHRFTVKTLKEFGFGKSQSMESAILNEMRYFLENLKNNLHTAGNNVLNVKQMFSMTVLNILWSMVVGVRFSYDDAKLKTLINYVEQIMTTIDVGGKLLMAFPFMRHLAPELSGHAEHIRLNGLIHEFIRSLLTERKAEGTYKENPKDFIDMFLQRMDQEEEDVKSGKLKPEKRHFTENQFIVLVTDFFMAGAETTANTMEFALMYMIMHPEVQRKVHAEIDSVIGQNRMPSIEDRGNLPYVEATMCEIQRMCNVIPMVPRYCRWDSHVGPYPVAKGEIVIVNLYSCHLHCKTWPDPQVFRPERYIVKDGDKEKFSPQSSNLSFGYGKRMCIGESYAKTVFFIYFITLMQLYTFENPPDGYSKPSLEPMRGATLSPKGFQATVKSRFPNNF